MHLGVIKLRKLHSNMTAILSDPAVVVSHLTSAVFSFILKCSQKPK